MARAHVSRVQTAVVSDDRTALYYLVWDYHPLCKFAGICSFKACSSICCKFLRLLLRFQFESWDRSHANGLERRKPERPAGVTMSAGVSEVPVGRGSVLHCSVECSFGSFQCSFQCSFECLGVFVCLRNLIVFEEGCTSAGIQHLGALADCKCYCAVTWSRFAYSQSSIFRSHQVVGLCDAFVTKSFTSASRFSLRGIRWWGFLISAPWDPEGWLCCSFVVAKMGRQLVEFPD